MIALKSDALEVTITPERGADIVQLVDRATGTRLLAESPTANAPALAGAPTDSMTQWLRGYPGGWQLLVPNAGPERQHNGARLGYHGEAALAAWTVLSQDAATCELETHLLSTPLHLRRTVSVVGDTLSVTDVITNLAPVPVRSRVVQHPAFGADFLDAESYIVVGNATIVTDAEFPGSLAAADVVGAPEEVLAAGPVPGSVRVPGPGSGESLFAALTDFAATEVTFCSPSRGIGIRLEWNREVLPHAWFWIEANAGAGWPWFQRMYSVAVEPANVLPGEGGSAAHPRGGDGTEIAGGQSLTMTTSMTRLAL